MNLSLTEALKLKYSTTEIQGLLPELEAGGDNAQPGATHRLVAADAFQEAGREAEARLLRSPHRIYVRKGKIYRQNHYEDFLGNFRRGYVDALQLGAEADHLQVGETEEIEADARHHFHSSSPSSLGFNNPYAAMYAYNAGHDFGWGRYVKSQNPEMESSGSYAGGYRLFFNPKTGHLEGESTHPDNEWGQPEGLPE